MAAPEAAVLGGGLSDPPRDAQAVFRSVLAALAEPGTVCEVPPVAAPPAPFPAAMGALALTLCDADTPVFLDPAFGDAAARWLRFHAGAAPVAREAARFAFLSVPDLPGLAVGDDAYPDRSATVVAVARFDGARLLLSGPGIPGRERAVDLFLSPAFVDQLAGNRALFPRGVDLLLVDGARLMGLPRTTAVRPADGEGA